MANNQSLADKHQRRIWITLIKDLLRTCAAEALSTHSGEHVETEVAVSRLIEVLQPPQMSTVVAHILERFIYLIACATDVHISMDNSYYYF